MEPTDDNQLPPEARQLPEPPSDGITQLCYLGTSSLLASTSWDGSVRVHETADSTAKLMLSQNLNCGPLLSLASDTSTLYCGALDGSIWSVPIGGNSDGGTEPRLVGQHQGVTDGKPGACSALGLIIASSEILLVSASWNGQLCIWQLDDNANGQKPLATLDLPGKAYNLHVHEQRVVVACAGRRIVVVDVTVTDMVTATLVLDRESTLKYQTRTVRFFPDGRGLAIGSVEGRVAIEYLDELQVASHGGKKFAFKCHRVNDLVYPVNAIAFHPVHITSFATGGGDGTVVTWDGIAKKKITKLPQFPTSIAALAFNHDGTEIAIASSYTFEEGEREHPRDEIYVRRMLESDCRPK